LLISRNIPNVSSVSLYTWDKFAAKRTIFFLHVDAIILHTLEVFLVFMPAGKKRQKAVPGLSDKKRRREDVIFYVTKKCNLLSPIYCLTSPAQFLGPGPVG
jgi:hypothetical protein